MEPGETSSTVLREKPGRTRGSRTDQDQFRVADPIDGLPNRVVYYGQVKVKVWLDRPLVWKAIYFGNYISQGKD